MDANETIGVKIALVLIWLVFLVYTLRMLARLMFAMGFATAMKQQQIVVDSILDAMAEQYTMTTKDDAIH